MKGKLVSCVCFVAVFHEAHPHMAFRHDFRMCCGVYDMNCATSIHEHCSYNVEYGDARSTSLGNAFVFARTTICFSCEIYPRM